MLPPTVATVRTVLPTPLRCGGTVGHRAVILSFALRCDSFDSIHRPTSPRVSARLGRPPSLPFSRAASDFALLLTLPRFEASHAGHTSGVPHRLQRLIARIPHRNMFCIAYIRGLFPLKQHRNSHSVSFAESTVRIRNEQPRKS
jgi:hypothetical protein